MTTQALTINFHGTDLFVVEHEGQPYTPMKTIVEGMGLAWQPQLAKLNANQQRWGITKIVIPTLGAMQESVCMPLRKLFGWLSTIHPNKVKPELRETIITYQNECDDVLWQHWQNKQTQYGLKQLPEPKTKLALPGGLTLEQQDVIKALVKERAEALPREMQAGATIRCWSAIKKKFGCSYKEVSPDNFVNIISLLSRLPLEGELLEKSKSLPAPSTSYPALPPIQARKMVDAVFSLELNDLIRVVRQNGYTVTVNG